MIEEAWVRDVAEMIWEAARLRRLKAKLMTISAGHGLHEVLRSIGVSFEEAHDLAPRWAARELAAVGQVEALLNAAGLDMHHITAMTLTLPIQKTLDKAERIDRMAAGAEQRRTNMLRELMLYRDPVFGARLRHAVAAADEAADGEIARLAAPDAPATAPEAVA